MLGWATAAWAASRVLSRLDGDHATPGHRLWSPLEYGMFKQSIVDGWQKENPDNWLRYAGDPWRLPAFTRMWKSS